MLVKSEDNKRIIRYRKSQKGQKIQWPKEKGRKDRKYSGQKKKDKRTNNDAQKHLIIFSAIACWIGIAENIRGVFVYFKLDYIMSSDVDNWQPR